VSRPSLESPTRSDQDSRGCPSTTKGTPASRKSAHFADWLEDRPSMWRIGASAGMGWEFPLSSQEKRELLMLNLAGETMAQRQQIAEMMQERSPDKEPES